MLSAHTDSKRIQIVMEPVKLKVNAKSWFVFFVFFYAISSGSLFFFVEASNQLIFLSTVLDASVVVVGAVMGIFYFFQKEVILTDREIKKLGFPSKTIAYSDIEMIRVGSGGFSIYDKSNDPVNITTMYSNFSDAKILLNQKLEDHSGIEIKGWKYFIDKYIESK